MTLNDKIKQLREQAKMTQNPKSVERLTKAADLFEQAAAAWKVPGQQVVAIRLETEADEVLRRLRD